MPTPSVFKKLSKQGLQYKWHSLAFAVIGLVSILLAIFISVKIEINLFPLIGVGFIATIWGWGVFLIINWFSKESKFALKLPVFIRSGFSWYAAFFLDAWFIVGSFGALYFIWSSISK